MKKLLLFLQAALFAGAITAQAKAKPAPLAEPTKAVDAPAPAPVAPSASAEFSMLGSLGVAFSESTYLLTCGGPKVGVKYGDFWFSAGLYPSLLYSDVYKNSNAATPVRPNLGAGIEIGYKRISIIAPVYYMPNNSYHYTFGIAYKFS